MESTFWLDADISALRTDMPIHFAHHRNPDTAENHRLHLNNHLEIYFFISGDHQYIVENALYTLKPGDAILISPRQVHKALPMDEGMYERFYFLLSDRALAGLQQDPLKSLLTRRGNLISFPEPVRQQVIHMLYGISECFQNGRNDQLMAFGLFLSILAELKNHAGRETAPQSRTAHTPELLRRILTYVNDHTASIQTTAEVATALGVSPQYLSTYFSRHIGTPLKTYIQAKKIGLAKDLLSQGADVTRTCFDCGFNDCSYFIRIFKKYVGVTPLVYKQQG